MIGKKPRRINPLKLLRMFSIIFLLAVSFTFFMKSSASGLTNDAFREVTVCPGDTLWQIAREEIPGENIEKVIYEIKNFNNLETSDIYPGQILKIPLKI